MANSIKVFISHKKEDEEIAKRVWAQIVFMGEDAYLDTIDSHLGKDGTELADYIRTQLGKCTHLIAVMTSNTPRSWWVPWEIGVATEKQRPLASYVSNSNDIPEYLRKWPYLKTMADLDQYIATAKETTGVLEESVRKHEATASAAATTAFRSFHSTLKRRLNQT